MNLHENTELFAELLTAASLPEGQGGLGIRQSFLEKDCNGETGIVDKAIAR